MKKVLSTLGQLPLPLRDDFQTRIDTGHKTRTKHTGGSKGEGTGVRTPLEKQKLLYVSLEILVRTCSRSKRGSNGFLRGVRMILSEGLCEIHVCWLHPHPSQWTQQQQKHVYMIHGALLAICILIGQLRCDQMALWYTGVMWLVRINIARAAGNSGEIWTMLLHLHKNKKKHDDDDDDMMMMMIMIMMMMMMMMISIVNEFTEDTYCTSVLCIVLSCTFSIYGYFFFRFRVRGGRKK